MNIVIVGSGLSGATAAALFVRNGHKVKVIETRSHHGGNCFDLKTDGITIHKYGPHVFHTNDSSVWNFLSNFTAWYHYEHRVMADTALGRISIPFSLKTESQLNCYLTDQDIQNLIFREYSEKQWGLPFEELPSAIRNRIPTRRLCMDDRYFTDVYQGQPLDGYSMMFERLLCGADVILGAKKNEWRKHIKNSDLLIYTGKIDEYFDFIYGELPYRSLHFDTEKTVNRLPYAAINQCNKLPFTRVYDHSWFLNERVNHTFLTKEYPCHHIPEVNIPFYPMYFGEAVKKYSAYKQLANKDKKTIFLGRLATYSYLDMWMAVAQSINKIKKLTSIKLV